MNANEKTIEQSHSLIDQVPQLLTKGFSDGMKMAIETFRTILIENLSVVLQYTLIVLGLGIFIFLTTGRWKLLGSVLYRILFTIILIVIIYVLGVDFFSKNSNLIFAIIGIISFSSVGMILRKFGTIKT